MALKRFEIYRRRRICATVSKLVIMVLGINMVLVPQADSRQSRSSGSGGQCNRNTKLSSSVYFLPHEKNYKNRKDFLAAVRLQGSGIQRNGSVRQYTGKVNAADPACHGSVKGAAGRCLIPMISIAADPKFYRMGDIIQVPSLKDKEIRMPDGKRIKHPGFFVVDDTGGAIKGPGRFDFYGGDLSWTDKRNDLGINGKYSMADKKKCQTEYTVVRGGSSGWQAAKDLIFNRLKSTDSNFSQVIARLNPGRSRR